MTDIDVAPPTSDPLALPYCDACGQWRIAGRQFCSRHPDQELSTRRLSGRGEVYSLTRSHTAMSPTVAELTPYLTALIATEEGPRLLAHIDGDVSPHIGDAVLLVAADDETAARLPGGGRRLARIVTEGRAV